MKKVIFIMGVLFATVLLFSSCSAKHSNNSFETTEQDIVVPRPLEYNTNVFWVVNPSSQELSIIGQGPAYCGSGGSNCPWRMHQYRNDIRFVHILEGVTYLSPYSFAGLDIQSCIMDAPVSEVGMGTFQACEKLVSVDLGNTKITRIPTEMFASCSSLTTVYLPSSLTSIASYAFFGTAIQTIYYPGSQEQWKNIQIEEAGNDVLNQATIIFNYRKE